MFMADPTALEAVLRAERKYPTAFREVEKIACFYTHLGYKVPLGLL